MVEDAIVLKHAPRSRGMELGLLGLLAGASTPSLALVFYVLTSGPRAELPILLSLWSGGVSGLAGAFVGRLVPWALRDDRVNPMLLFPLGFPTGSLVGGGIAGLPAVFGLLLLPSSTVATNVVFGTLTGGFFVGLLWIPWLALMVRGRSTTGLLIISLSLLPFLVVGVLFLEGWSLFMLGL